MSTVLRVTIVNPNSTAAFTRNISRAVPIYIGVSYRCLTNTSSDVPSINGATTQVLSAASMFHQVLADVREHTGCDGVLIACFSNHPLVPMLREALDPRIPVVGIFDAALIHASQLGASFGIVTTEKRWEPMLTDDVRRFGFSHRCAGVVSAGLTVLEAESLPRDEVARMLATKAQWLVQEKGADCIILGCAGFVGLDAAVKQAVGEGVPVIDGISAGVEVLLGLVRRRQKTSAVGLYAPL